LKELHLLAQEGASSPSLWAGAGGRRASELPFTSLPVATRNRLAPPPPRGAPVEPENQPNKGSPKPRISPQSPADYGTDPDFFPCATRIQMVYLAQIIKYDTTSYCKYGALF
jgi:hypothetical protein